MVTLNTPMDTEPGNSRTDGSGGVFSARPSLRLATGHGTVVERRAVLGNTLLEVAGVVSTPITQLVTYRCWTGYYYKLYFAI